MTRRVATIADGPAVAKKQWIFAKHSYVTDVPVIFVVVLKPYTSKESDSQYMAYMCARATAGTTGRVSGLLLTCMSIGREGEYPTSLWYCATTLSLVHDLCNNIHKLEVSQYAICGHASKSFHPREHHYSNCSCYGM